MVKRITNRPWKLEALQSDTEARNVILPDDKVRAIVAAGYRLDPAFGVVVAVLAETGTRISQALKLTVEDPLPGDRLNMPTSKKGKGAKKTDRGLEQHCCELGNDETLAAFDRRKAASVSSIRMSSLRRPGCLVGQVTTGLNRSRPVGCQA